MTITDKYKATESNWSSRYPICSNYALTKKHNLTVPILESLSFTQFYACKYILDFGPAHKLSLNSFELN